MGVERDDRPAPLRERRVLVVDDDPDIRRMISTVLEAAGARVEVAGSGTQAERLLNEHDYDAVLLDWNLDDMPAADFLDRAERCRAGISRRIAVMTGDLIHRHDTHAAEQRGMPLLRKPFRPKELVAAVIRTLAPRER